MPALISGSKAGALPSLFPELLVKLPCLSNVDANTCKCQAVARATQRMGGNPGTVYTVTLRIRGVVEHCPYGGGTNDGAFFQNGGAPTSTSRNVYGFHVEDPAHIYYLNRGATITPVYAIDYAATVQIAGGSMIELFAMSELDNEVVYPVNTANTLEIKNVNGNGWPALSVAGAPIGAQPYDGQFIWIVATDVR